MFWYVSVVKWKLDILFLSGQTAVSMFSVSTRHTNGCCLVLGAGKMKSKARSKELHNSPILVVKPLNNRLTQNNQCWYIKHIGAIFCDFSTPLNYPTNYLISF